MRIQHNIAALNSHRQLGANNTAVSKNLEKLSSGYKINRAGDDAAGLAISEKMRAQIKGLETATNNANDGISLVQTAEGALTEVHSMLNRMVELATQSANGTYDNETDRANLQKEVESLKSEIDRIAESTNYNGINLLDGSLGSAGTSSSANVSNGGKVAYVSGEDVAITTNAATKDKFGGVTNAAVNAGKTFTLTYADAEGKSITKSWTPAANTTINAIINGDDELSKIFLAGADGVESRVAGAKTPKVLSMTNDGTAVAKVAADSVTGEDASISFEAPAISAGTSKTVTIGDKTYELVDTAGAAKKGNVEVVVGTPGTTENADLVEALKKNGVTSASIDATGVKISDLNQIAVDAKSNSVSVDATSGSVVATAATKNTYTGTFSVVGTAGSQTLNISVIDANGDTKDFSINYTGSATAATNQSNIETALSNSAEFGKYFDIDTTTHEIKAKEAGTSGAKLAGFTTTDAAAAVNKKFNFATTNVGTDSQKTLEMSEIGAGTTVTVDGKTYEFVNEGSAAKSGNVAVAVGANLNESTKNLANTLKNNGVNVSYDNANKITFDNSGKAVTSSAKGLTLQIGDTAEKFNKVTVQVDNMNTKSLGIADISVAKQEDASAAIEKIKAAINSVSATRGDLGAVQNRLEHTINNLGVANENMTAAESRIRDVDMAKEMMEFTKNNILTQASQAMLAQANQLPQGVLQLLQ